MESGKGPTRRARLRAAATREIKDAAWAQIHALGAEKLSLRAVAVAMDMSPAGLYRYYDSREELLTDLVTDAFHALADALETARDAVADAGPGGRLLAASLAYRRWALAQPRVFALLYGAPVPGYAAPVDGPAMHASIRVSRAFLEVFAGASAGGALPPPAMPDDWTLLGEKAADLGLDLPGDVLALAIGMWGRLHGLVCLEVFGHLKWAGPAAAALYHAQVTADLAGAGLNPGTAPMDGWSGG